ncbi:hypothetical protein VTN31DRAFT_2126 [Thermomyces dupontii]|uniref:uncharacterized protein n=1 Tax=Talaromyces thermophilus TaxID=28565 RepID=UPI003743B41B
MFLSWKSLWAIPCMETRKSLQRLLQDPLFYRHRPADFHVYHTWELKNPMGAVVAQLIQQSRDIPDHLFARCRFGDMTENPKLGG